MRSYSWGDLVLLGMVMGVLHVLTGPDHMAAMATLSVNNTWRAFSTGVRWGAGHSTGLIVVCIIFLSLPDGAVDLEKVGSSLEWLVGVFMTVLGLWKLRECFLGTPQTEYVEQVCSKDMEHDASSDCEPNASQSDLTLADEVPAPVHVHTHKCGSLAHTHNAMELGIDIPPRGYQQVHKDMEHDDASEFDPGPSSRGVLQVDEPVAHDKLTHVHVLTHSLKMKVQADAMRCMQVCNCWDRLQGKEHLHRYRCRDTNIISFGMGIIHGLAGPGGVMGVLPAIEIHVWSKSLTYLASFVVVSTITMGCVASAFGEITSHVSDSVKVGFILKVVSAVLCICVGCLWLVLLPLGILDQVFP